MVFLDIVRNFSLKNEGFRVLKTEKNDFFFLMFKDFFVEEQRI